MTRAGSTWRQEGGGGGANLEKYLVANRPAGDRRINVGGGGQNVIIFRGVRGPLLFFVLKKEGNLRYYLLFF